MTGSVFLQIGALYGALGVMLGAFGAHGLKPRLEASALDAFETGVRYQFYHALALLVVGLLMRSMPSGLLRGAGVCFSIGAALFSGSLYLLATRSLLPLGELRVLGPVTPLGGLVLIVGWGLLLVAALKA